MPLKRTPFLYRLTARLLVFAFVVDPLAFSQSGLASVRPAKGTDLPPAWAIPAAFQDPIAPIASATSPTPARPISPVVARATSPARESVAVGETTPPTGATTPIASANGGGGSSSTCEYKLTHDQSPLASLSKTQLWPVNHSLVDVGYGVDVTSACEDRVTTKVAVYSDEPDEDQTGDGNFPGDAKIDHGDLFLRAERKGNSDGRVYLIITTATLPNGPTGVDCDTVTVPKSQSKHDLDVVKAQAATAKSYCQAHAAAPTSYVKLLEATLSAANQPPVVNAGPDLAVDFPPGTVTIHGTATDDGRPNGRLCVSWTKVSGPSGGVVTFSRPGSADTGVTFSKEGTYVLRLKADDGQLSSSDDVTIVVATANNPPVVNAGPDQDLTLPVSTASLDGTLTDDGRPVAASVTWSLVSPVGAAVTFANAHAVDTTATLPGVGEYVLRLTATDTVFTASDDVKVTVHEQQAPVLSVADVSVAEGQEGTTGAVVTFTLSKPWSLPVTADYKTADGTATAGCDYRTVFGSIRFEPGQTSIQALVPVFGELVPEADETVFVQVDNVSSATRERPQSTLTILNDDVANAPPTVILGRSPADRSTGIVLPPTLAWTSTDPDAGDTLAHDVYLGTSFSVTGQSWSRTCAPGQGPGPRAAAVTGYDEGNDRLIVFGGTGTTDESVWILENATGAGGAPEWTSIPTVAGPVGLSRAAAAYDAATNRLFVFGGCTGDCEQGSDQAWVLSNANGTGGAPVWSLLPATGPAARIDHALAFDPTRRALILFGGSEGAAGALLGDVWLLEGVDGAPAWRLLATAGMTPSARAGMSASYDPEQNLLVVFGGRIGTSVLADTWVLRNANGSGGSSAWTQLAPVGTPPPPRWAHASAYDPVTARLVVFGGSTAAANPAFRFHFSDLWMLKDATTAPEWVRLTVNSGPTGRVQTASGFSLSANRLVLAGGATNNEGTTEEVWTLGDAMGTLPLVASQPTPPFIADGLTDALYYWRIVARDGHGAWRGSTAWRFTANQPPLVEAGPDQEIRFPVASVSLSGTASDDGRPAPSAFTTTWTASGPASVGFADPASVVTTATFTIAGTYVLTLTATDGMFTVSDSLTVVVRNANEPPLVNAGPDQTIVLPGSSNEAPPFIQLVRIQTGFSNPIGIDYHQPTNKMVMSVNYPSGQPYNFELVAADGSRQRFGNISGLTDELKIAVVPDEGGGFNRGGFPAGTLFSGTGQAGAILRVSPDGSVVDNPWLVLPNEGGLLRGSLHLDRTGVFGGDLIVVTTNGGVWRVKSTGVATKLAQIPTHLEGLNTIPDDPARYGPWAGKILAGAEQQSRLYTVDAQGAVAFFELGIAPEDIEVIPANQNFFGSDFGGGNLWGIRASSFTGMVGDVLIAQETPGILWWVRWNGSSFDVSKIAQVTQWEHVAFGAAGILDVASTSATVTLHGTVSDDGLPLGQLTSSWSRVPGPGAVSFAQPAQPVTNATLSEPGTYDLQLTASDGALEASDTMTVTVVANQAPVVNAGPDQSVNAPGPAALNGTVTDDGLPTGSTLSSFWTKVLGPGTVTFAAPTADATLDLSPINNPSGPWTYGYQPLGGAFTPFTLSGPIGGLPAWFRINPQPNSFEHYPLVMANQMPFTYSVGSGEFLTGESLFLTPGPQGRRAVVRWTAPAAGTYLVQGLFQSMSSIRPAGTTQDVAIAVQGTELARRNLGPTPDAAPFSIVRTLGAGDIVEFSVGWGSDLDFRFDDTILSVRITPASSPSASPTFSSPGTYLLRLTGSDGERFSSDEVTVRVTPTACTPISTTPVGWWPGEGNAGNVAGGPPATLLGGVGFAPGKVGQGFVLDGVDDAIVAPASPSLNVSSFTLEGWIRPGTTGRFEPIFEYTNPNTRIGVHLWHSYSRSVNGLRPGTLYANLRDAGFGDHQLESGPGVVRPGEWVHVALTYDATTGRAQIFVNGSSVAVAVFTPFVPATSMNLNLGYRPANAESPTVYRFTGQLDEMTVFGRALSADEIRAIASVGAFGKCRDVNQSPVVNAGPDLTALLRCDQTAVASLLGSVTDDGLPAGSTLTSTWTSPLGPAPVQFSSAGSPHTDATFTAAGDYTVRLAASDSELAAQDLAAVHVVAFQPPTGAFVASGILPSQNGSGGPAPVTVNGLTVGRTYTLYLWGSWQFGNGPVGTARNNVLTSGFGNPTVVLDSGAPPFNPGAPLVVRRFEATATSVVMTILDSLYSDNTGELSFQMFEGVPGEETPVVNAGPDQTLTFPLSATALTGSVLDGGRPPASGTTFVWTQVSGPAATLASPSSMTTAVSLGGPGTYVFRLSATNCFGTRFDDVQVELGAPACTASLGMKAWWPGDGHAVDLIQGRVASLTNGAGYASGVDDAAFQLDGNASVVDFGGDVGNFGTSDFTISFWVRAPVAGGGVLNQRQFCGPSNFWDIRMAGGGRLYTELFEPPRFNAFLSVGSASGDLFHHVALVRQGAEARLYIDGAFDSSHETSGTVNLQNAAHLLSGPDVCVGTGDGTTRFQGALDELILFERALSAEEIGAYYVKGSFGDCEVKKPALVVDAGEDRTITLPIDTVTLEGTAKDRDGAPLTASWSKVSGPGTVAFASPGTLLTTVRFESAGAYVLRLTVSNGRVQAHGDVTVTVAPPTGDHNLPPAVDAGPDQSLSPPTLTATLAGTVTDDGLPGGAGTVVWSKVSGPGGVTFGDPSQLATTATFGGDGTYVLRLTASDGTLSSRDDVVITVGECTTAKLFVVSRQTGEQNPSTEEVFRYDVSEAGTAALDATIVHSSFDGAGLVVFTPSGSMLVVSTGTFTGGPGLLTRFTDPNGLAVFDGTLTSPAFNRPHGAAFRGNELFVAQRFGRNVLRFRFDSAGLLVPNGQITEGLGGPFPGPGEQTVARGVATTPSGDLLVSLCCAASQINHYKFDAAGNATLFEVIQGNGLSNPHGMAFSSWGELFVASPGPVSGNNYSGRTISRFLFDAETGRAVPNGQFAAAGLNGAIGLTFTPWDELFIAAIDLPAQVARFTFDATHVPVAHGFMSIPNTGGFVGFSNACPLGQGNRAPGVNAGPDQSLTLPETSASLSASVADDNRPMPPTLQVSWSQIAGPSAVVFADPSQKSTAVTLGAPGIYVLRITASDGEFTSSDDLRIDVHAEANEPPVVNAGPDRTVTLPAHTITINGSITDDGRPSGTLTISWTQVFPPLSQATVTFSSPQTAVTDATFPVAGVYVLRLTGSDGDFTVTSHVTVTVNAPTPNQPPSVDAGPNQALTLPTNSTTLTGAVLDDGLPVGGTLTFKWTAVDPSDVVTFGTPTALSTTVTFGDPGFYTLRLTASDGELSASDVVQVSVATAPQTGPPPVAALTAPADGSRLTGPTLVAGTAQSGTLLSWKLEYRLEGETTYTRFATGSTSVVASTLGTLDPTMLLNGIYEVRLTATDISGRLQRASQKIVVRDNQKIGPFSLSFVDLDVPVAGLPMRVTRTYDSRDKGKGDFGYGWRLDLSNVRLSEKEIAGLAWRGRVVPGFFPGYCLEPTSPQVVTVTLTDGRLLEFEPVITPSCQQYIPIEGATVSFRPLPGTNATLAPAGDGFVFVVGSWPGPMELYDGSSYDIFDPIDYILTLPDGRQLSINQTKGLTALKDLNGNLLTVSSSGITHSSGVGIAFTRDGQGRITSITDPDGNAMGYTYDAAGDLRSFTDRESHTTRFTYNLDQPHLLETIEDPRGIQPIRNEYYEDGRLKSHTDAFGKTVTYTHDVDARQEVVTDREGGVRVIEYDARGNVVRETDPEGKVVDRTFDTRNNMTSQSLPHEPGAANPPKTVWVYDAADNVLSMTDPEGNITEYTYNARNQVLSMKDPRGTYTFNIYDSRGNLTSTKVSPSPTGTPVLSESSYAIRPDGKLESETVVVGGVASTTRYAYDAVGNVSRETDAQGHETGFSYDGRGNRLSQTATRMTPTGAETLTTQYSYDKLGHLVRTTDPDGTSTRTVYDELGRPKETYDKLDRRTALAYDDNGRLIRRTHPDLTTEESTYDAEGRRLTSKDRGGRVTRYEYDKTGRLTKVIHPDDTFAERTYDAVGRLVLTQDERGKTTSYTYDAVGRQTSVKVPLGGGVFAETAVTYDGAGNQRTVRDPNLHTVLFEYDAQNRPTKTIFPDASYTERTYDSLGRRLSERDQAGKITRFEYDTLGRLVKVIDPLTRATAFGYDEMGNRIRQTDANNHTTSFEYDKLGREVKRVLPGGASETRTYDAAGNVRTRTDFNGNTTTYEYDLANRLTSRTYSGGAQPAVTFTYTPSGRRQTVSIGSSTTVYSYDLRDRATRVTHPDGRKLEYGYDASGNRTSVKATIGTTALTTGYTYDDGSRPDLVTDPLGRIFDLGYDTSGNRTSLTQPNGTTTSYVYDELNRLRSLTTARPASGVTIQSYAFTLGASGDRTRIVEGDGTTLDYGYDDLYRLTSERATSGGLLRYEKAFSYDHVGNRQTQSTTGAGATGTPTAPGVVSYGYDDRDRLLEETLGTNPPTAYTYDLNGSLITKDAEATYTWDRDDRLVKVEKGGTIVEHAYDADGNRLQTRVTPPTGPPTVTNYLVDPAGPLSQVVAESAADGSLQAYYVRGDDLLAILRPTGPGTWSTRYVHADGIGSIRRLTDDTGAITDGYSYTAFGELIAHTGTDPQPYAFAGEAYDPNTGFQFHRARWMDPRAGRFVSADPFRGSPFEPHSLHRYLYAAGNPVSNVDPTGLFDFNMGSMMTALSVVGVLSNLAGLIGNLHAFLATDDLGEKARILPNIGLNIFGLMLAAVGGGPFSPAPALAGGGGALVGGAQVVLSAQKARLLGSVLIPIGQGIGAIGVLMMKNGGHTAQWELRDEGGNVKESGEVSSGGTSPGRRLNWQEQLNVHTERKILEQLRAIVKKGDVIDINGTKPPCNPGGVGCQSAMANFAQEMKVTIRYFQEGVGEPWVFKP